MDRGRLASVSDQVARRAAALMDQPDFPTEYLRRVRNTTAAFGVMDRLDGSVRQAARLLHQQAAIEMVDVPMIAATPARRVVKAATIRLVGWYLRVLADQVTQLGRSTARLGLSMAESIEGLDAQRAALRSETEDELRRLRARVAELEKALAASPDDR